MRNSSMDPPWRIDPTTLCKRSYHRATSRFCIKGKERNVLVNDALNTFYLRLYGIWDMLKDHSDSERWNLLPPLHGLIFLISSKGTFICTIPIGRITHTSAFVNPVMELHLAPSLHATSAYCKLYMIWRRENLFFIIIRTEGNVLFNDTLHIFLW